MVPHFTEVAQQGLPATGESLRKGRHRVQLMQIQPHLIRLLSLAYQTLYQHEVGRRVQEQGLGGQAVPACPPRLPVVRLKALGHVIVDHVADIWLINPQAEGDRSHHYLEFVTLKGILHPLALRATKTRVIRGDGACRGGDRRRHLLRTFATEAVDDSRLPLPLLHEPAELPGRAVFFHYLIADVGSVEACGKNFRMRQPEARKNVPTCLLCLLYTSPSPRDGLLSRMPSSA